MRSSQLVYDALRVISDGNRAVTARTCDLEGHHGFAIQQRDLRTIGVGVLDRRDLIQPHMAAIGQADIQRRQVLCPANNRQGAKRLPAIANFRAAT